MNLLLCLAIYEPQPLAAEKTNADRPNIVLIFADDLGWADVGYQGSDFYETPNLDALAKQGMVFTAAYAAAGNCAPSRACLMSGTYTPRHHVYAVGSTDRGPKASQRLVPVPNKNGLAREVVTLADALKSAGYVTGHFGKWHLGDKEGSRPTEQGFDVSFDSFGEGEVAQGSEGNKTGPPSDPKGVFTLTRNPVIRGRELDVRAGFRTRPVSVINKAGWKLHLYHEEWQLDGGRDTLASHNAVELYNLTDDVGERNNLANANPVKRDELLADLFAWFKSADAMLPTKMNPHYDPLAQAVANKRAANRKKQ